MNICPGSALWSAPRVWEKGCSPSPLPLPIQNIRSSASKSAAYLPDYLHSLQIGDEIAVRGPYGNHFPVETALKGKDLLFIAGGIGLAPLRSVINYVLDNRENYGKVDILYGSRSADDLVQLTEIRAGMGKSAGSNSISYHRPAPGGLGRSCGFVPHT